MGEEKKLASREKIRLNFAVRIANSKSIRVYSVQILLTLPSFKAVYICRSTRQQYATGHFSHNEFFIHFFGSRRADSFQDFSLRIQLAATKKKPHSISFTVSFPFGVPSNNNKANCPVIVPFHHLLSVVRAIYCIEYSIVFVIRKQATFLFGSSGNVLLKFYFIIHKYVYSFGTETMEHQNCNSAPMPDIMNRSQYKIEMHFVKLYISKCHF